MLNAFFDPHWPKCHVVFFWTDLQIYTSHFFWPLKYCDIEWNPFECKDLQKDQMFYAEIIWMFNFHICGASIEASGLIWPGVMIVTRQHKRWFSSMNSCGRDWAVNKTSGWKRLSQKQISVWRQWRTFDTFTLMMSSLSNPLLLSRAVQEDEVCLWAQPWKVSIQLKASVIIFTTIYIYISNYCPTLLAIFLLSSVCCLWQRSVLVSGSCFTAQ